jgi:hypothetical protein
VWKAARRAAVAALTMNNLRCNSMTVRNSSSYSCKHLKQCSTAWVPNPMA